MHNQVHEPIEVLRQSLGGQRLVDEDVVSSAVLLADKLEHLKRTSPMFEAVSFSPDVEAMMAEHMVAN